MVSYRIYQNILLLYNFLKCLILNFIKFIENNFYCEIKTKFKLDKFDESRDKPAIRYVIKSSHWVVREDVNKIVESDKILLFCKKDMQKIYNYYINNYKNEKDN